MTLQIEQKKPMIITNLGVRFYERDGWNLPLLNQYLNKGAFIKKGHSWDWVTPVYFTPEFNSEVNYEQLALDGHISELIRDNLNDRLNKLTDKELLTKVF